jgi:hypothetical protein
VHTVCENTSDDVKDSLYEKLGRVFVQFPRYDMKNFLGDFNVKVGKKMALVRIKRNQTKTIQTLLR